MPTTQPYRSPEPAQPQHAAANTTDADALQKSISATDAYSVTYVPFGESKEISFRVRDVRLLMSVKTKRGHEPSDRDCIRFAKLCQAKGLNPWVHDAFLIGYDTKNGPEFSQITAYQALLKRAEANHNFAGMESGLLVFNEEESAGELISREGALPMPNDKIYGAWAIVYRDDHTLAGHKARIKFATYNTGWSRWEADPAGQACKVAKAAALREAFPTQLGGLYTGEEMDHVPGDAQPTADDADAALEQAAEGALDAAPGPDNPAGHDPTPSPETPPGSAQGEPEPAFNPPSEEELESDRAQMMDDFRGLIAAVDDKKAADKLAKDIAAPGPLTQLQRETLQAELATHVAKN